MNIQENISLKPFNTFGIDKKARFFVVVHQVEQLKTALTWASKNKVDSMVLGGGSNILLTQDPDMLVIKLEIKGINPVKKDDEHIWVEVGAGEVWHEFVMRAIENNWSGVENLSLIPGTVGASPMQNIGAYGVEIKEVFESLEALNKETLKMERFDRAACKFGYRESIFKHELKDKYIICSVIFRLALKPRFEITYGTVKETLQKKGITELSSRSVSDAVIEIRQSKLPDPKVIGNSGSFFKNPTIDPGHFVELQASYPTIPGFENPEGVKVPAAWLIEQCGWKGKRFGDVGVHDRQPLVLVNYGNGEGRDIVELASKIQASVKEKFGINLQPEVNYI